MHFEKESEEIQSRVVNAFLSGEKVSLQTFQAGKIGTNAKEIFRCLSKLNLDQRLAYYKVLRLRDLKFKGQVSYAQIRRELPSWRLYPISLELSLILASTHWEWRKPENVDIKFFMNPIETLYGPMGFMMNAPGNMLDGYEIDQTCFDADEVFVFGYLKDLRAN